jgi:hypothetical protein
LINTSPGEAHPHRGNFAAQPEGLRIQQLAIALAVAVCRNDLVGVSN